MKFDFKYKNKWRNKTEKTFITIGIILRIVAFFSIVNYGYVSENNNLNSFLFQKHFALNQ